MDRRFRRQNDDQTADFISCVAFGRQGEFAEKYLHQGTKIVVSGRLQTGSYTKNDGTRVYTTDVVIEEQDFAESKSVSSENAASYQPPQGAPAPAPAQASGGSGSAPAADPDGFMNIPDGIDEELPFQ